MSHPVSLHSESFAPYRIRRDLQRKISTIIESNGTFPIIAIGLIRDLLKGRPEIRSTRFDSDESPREIIITMVLNEGLTTEYYFPLKPHKRVETPTL